MGNKKDRVIMFEPKEKKKLVQKIVRNSFFKLKISSNATLVGCHDVIDWERLIKIRSELQNKVERDKNLIRKLSTLISIKELTEEIKDDEFFSHMLDAFSSVGAEFLYFHGLIKKKIRGLDYRPIDVRAVGTSGRFLVMGLIDVPSTDRRLNDFVDIEEEFGNIEKEFENLEIKSLRGWAKARGIFRTILLLLLAFYTPERERQVFYSHSVQRSILQPYNRTKQLIRITARRDLPEDILPKEIRENIQNWEIKELDLGAKTVYEQMLIEIIGDIVFTNKKQGNGTVKSILIYLTGSIPATYDEINQRYIISLEELAQKYNLTREEVRRIFLGERGNEPAVKKLAQREFMTFAEADGKHKFEIIKHLFSYMIIDSGTDAVLIIEDINPIFHRIHPFQQDDLNKLRQLRELVNPKEQRNVLRLRNVFITLPRAFEYKWEKLARIAGMNTLIKQRKKRKIKENLKRYLDYLRAIGEIKYRIERDKVIIEPITKKPSEFSNYARYFPALFLVEHEMENREGAYWISWQTPGIRPAFLSDDYLEDQKDE